MHALSGLVRTVGQCAQHVAIYGEEDAFKSVRCFAPHTGRSGYIEPLRK